MRWKNWKHILSMPYISSFARSRNCLCVAVMRWEKIILTWWFADSLFWCFSSNALSLFLSCSRFRAFPSRFSVSIDEKSQRMRAEGGHGGGRVVNAEWQVTHICIWITISFSANNKNTTDHDWAPCINFRSIRAINNLPHLCSAIVHTTMYGSQSLFIWIRQ